MRLHRISQVAILLIVAAIAIAGCAGGALGTVTGVKSTPRTITVTGGGTVHIAPDIATLVLGVHNELSAVEGAVQANNDATANVIAALKERGVATGDIQTYNFSVYPNTQFSPDGTPISRTFVVDNTVNVTIRQIDQVGPILALALGTGASTVSGVSFALADKSIANAQARDLALSNAHEQAVGIAKALGLELSDIQSVTYHDGVTAPTNYPTGVGGGGGGAGPVPIESGEVTLTVSVDVTYIVK